MKRHTGAGWSITSVLFCSALNGISKQRESSVFQAEVFAIKQAVENLHKRNNSGKL
ncbi:Hypothetical protein FKW44_022595, partial [Caligus rogercresseyi]